MLKRDFPERSMALGQGPAAKRRDSSGTPGRFVSLWRHTACKFDWCFLKVMHGWFICTNLFVLTFSSRDVMCNLLVYCTRLWSRVVTTRTSQDRNRPSSRLDSEGEEEEDDTDKVIMGFIKGRALGKLTSFEQGLAINLPGCFHLLFLLPFIRKTKNARLKNPTDLLHKNLMKPLGN